MKTRSSSLLASLIILTVMPAASAADPSPRQIEEDPALVRVATQDKQRTCKFCAVAANAAYLRSPRTIEENPEFARTLTCAVEVPVRGRRLIGAGVQSWPRILETR